MNDPRTEEVKEILLDDGQEENIEFARKYKITATPTLIVVDENDEKVEEYVGGVPITQNIVKLLDQYSD
jgi:thioredoxin-related protein